MKPKIAIIHNLPSGGGIRMLSEIIKRYSSKCNIDIISISVNEPRHEDNTNLYWFKVNPWKGFFLYNLWIYFVLPFIHQNVSKKIKWTEYHSIFVTHDYFTKSPYILRNINSKKIIYLCQEPQREYYEKSEIHAPYIKDKIANFFRYPIKLIDEKNVSYVDTVLCNSKYSKNILDRIYKRNCRIVYPGVDIDTFKPSKQKKENCILCVGGINRIKNQEFIVDSLKSILSNYKLVLIGSGRKKEITDLLNNAKGIKIEIIEHVDDTQLLKYYRSSKVTCIAAYGEPFGLSSIESQACGTPVVAIDDGGPKESIKVGKTGYLAKREKKDFLIKVQKALLDYKKLGRAGEENIHRNWTWEITLIPLDKYFFK